MIILRAKPLMPILALICLLCGNIHAATARTWSTHQGNVLQFTIDLPAGEPSLHAFGKSWPWQRLKSGKVQAWIGIDMGKKSGAYVLKIVVTRPDQSHWTRRDTVQVIKENFRVSHIKVTKKMSVFDAKALARIHADQADLRRSYRMHVDVASDMVLRHMPVQGIISTPFGARRYVNGEPRSPHSGIDIAVNKGTPILNPLAGRVLLASAMFLNGNTVVIGHGRGLVSVYSHMQSLEVQPGQWLATDAVIGHVGQTGRATGPHLHWGVRFQNARITPLSLMQRKE